MKNTIKNIWAKIDGSGIVGFRFTVLAWLLAATLIAPQSALAVFSSQAASTISWFYAAAFSRSPVPNSALPNYGDIGGLIFWTDAFLAGEGDFAPFRGNVYAIADFFVTSDEFQAKYPTSLTNTEFVTALYQNMLGRAPDTAGRDFWVGRLDGGASRGTVLADFANTVENQDSNPVRKAALQSYIAFIATDANGIITTTEAAMWLAANPTLDGAIVDDENRGLAEIRGVQLAGAEGDNRYDLFVGQPLATGPAQVEFSEGQQTTLKFTLLSGPPGLTVDGDTGAINYQPPDTVIAESKPFQIRVTHGTATFAVAGSLELVAAQQVETATSNGVSLITLGGLVEIDGNALPTGMDVVLRTGVTAAGDPLVMLTLPAPLAEGSVLRLNTSALPRLSTGGASEDEDCPDYAPHRWQGLRRYFFGGVYRWPDQLLAEGIEIPWQVINPLIGPYYQIRLVERTASVLCSEFATGNVIFTTDAQPVLLVHGYTIFNKLGGGAGTWNRMVAELRTQMSVDLTQPEILPFEFRWRTNARFEDVAADLSLAVEQIKQETGKDVHLVAHSFGGLLARTYLQGLADLAGGYSSAPVATLTTVGAPHSGIFASSSSKYPQGADQNVSGMAATAGCLQLSCFQAGQSTVSLGQQKNFVEWLLGAEYQGEIIRDLESISHPFLVTDLPVQVLIGLRTWEESTVNGNRITFLNGDGLISFDGQRFLPSDRKQQTLRREDQQAGNLGAKVSEYVIAVDTTDPDLEGQEVTAITGTDDSLFPGFGHTSTFLDDGTFDSIRALKAEVDVDNSDHEILPYLAYWIVNRSAPPNAPLNDTGITYCGDATRNGLSCPVPGFPGQDAQFGRDVTHNDNSDGCAGFSFTKLDSNGNPLPASATSWSCVYDNVTKLTWEVKTDDGGLRDKDNTYTWYDAETYVQAVNAQELCGVSDWRLPSKKELMSLVNYAIPSPGPTIDTNYFPDTQPSWYWSSSGYANYPTYAWYVYFDNGYAVTYPKATDNYVRLVCGEQ